MSLAAFEPLASKNSSSFDAPMLSMEERKVPAFWVRQSTSVCVQHTVEGRGGGVTRVSYTASGVAHVHFVRSQFRNANRLVEYYDHWNRMHDSFSSRSTIRVWEISVCLLDSAPLISSLGTNV